jgi:sugar lactone lactonase YvrE
MADLQHNKQRELVELVRRFPGDWSAIRVHVCANVTTTQLSISADIRLPRGPRGISGLVGELRKLMADPQQGAWLMADFVVPRSGEATFSYDWMSKPDWPGTSGTFSGDYDDVGYLDDLTAFPRAPEHIPDWYPSPENVIRPPAFVDTDAARPPPPPPRRGEDPDVAVTGLSFPFGMAVDAAGSLYVTDTGNDRVVVLAAAAAAPVVLPLPDLSEPCGLAVDDSGTVYIADSLNDRVLSVTADNTGVVQLPLNGLHFPGGIAIDADGALYVTDRTDRQVLTLAPGAPAPTVLPFTGLRWLIGVAVDNIGTVYVADRAQVTDDPIGGRILALAPGSAEPIELAIGIQRLGGIAVDDAGGVYVTEKVSDGRVLKLADGAFSIIASGLHEPAGIAVDNDGNFYVAEMPPGDDSDDHSRGRILKRPIPW